MEWLASNWIWIVLAIGFFALHRLGRGGHRHGGGHGAHSHQPDRRDPRPPGNAVKVATTAGADPHAAHVDASAPDARKPHRHRC